MSEETAIAAFNSDHAAQLLRDKVRIAFVELMPADKWEEMIKNEWNAFLRARTVKRGHGYHEKTEVIPSQFSILCNEVLRELFKERLSDPETSMRAMLEEQIKAKLGDEVPKILQDVFLQALRDAGLKAIQQVVETYTQNVIWKLQSQ